jgi:hypothetical protein
LGEGWFINDRFRPAEVVMEVCLSTDAAVVNLTRRHCEQQLNHLAAIKLIAGDRCIYAGASGSDQSLGTMRREKKSEHERGEA